MTARLPAVLGALLFAAAPVLADDVPDLTGTWVMVETSGVRQGDLGHSDPTAEPTFEPRGGIWTTTIAEQHDRSFTGTRASEGRAERLIGTIGYDDRTIYMVDEDSHLYGRLLDDGRMEICILETGAGAMIAVCSLNERQE